MATLFCHQEKLRKESLIDSYLADRELIYGPSLKQPPRKVKKKQNFNKGRVPLLSHSDLREEMCQCSQILTSFKQISLSSQMAPPDSLTSLEAHQQ